MTKGFGLQSGCTWSWRYKVLEVQRRCGDAESVGWRLWDSEFVEWSWGFGFRVYVGS